MEEKVKRKEVEPRGGSRDGVEWKGGKESGEGGGGRGGEGGKERGD